MRIEQWAVGHSESPYAAPELGAKSLHGCVFGHPRFPDGAEVTTSSIVGVEAGCIVTHSGSRYKLGEPHPEYEQRYPNAKQRLLALAAKEEAGC